jgi:hypothetical protein
MNTVCDICDENPALRRSIHTTRNVTDRERTISGQTEYPQTYFNEYIQIIRHLHGPLLTGAERQSSGECFQVPMPFDGFRCRKVWIS